MRMDAKEKKRLLKMRMQECSVVAKEKIASWKPVDPSWETVEGFAYVRLSTDKQVLLEKGSFEQQVHITFQEAISRSRSDRKNYKIIECFRDAGVSGRTDRRPGFQCLKDLIMKGSGRFVIVKELTRLTRDVETWLSFSRLCSQKRCSFFVPGLDFNPSDPSCEVMFSILAIVAAYESRLIGKRVRDNFRSALLSSGKLSSTHPVLGLDPLVRDGVCRAGFYSVNKEEAQKVEAIMKIFLRYGSYQKTLEEINKMGIRSKRGVGFNPGSLKRFLMNEKLVGMHSYFDSECNEIKSIKLPHGEVVPFDLFSRVQEKMASVEGLKNRNKASRVFILTGLLQKSDGSRFGGSSAWGGSGKKYKYHYYKNNQTSEQFDAEILEKEAIDKASEVLRGSLTFKDAFKKSCDERNSMVKHLQNHLSEIESQIELIFLKKDNLNKRLDWHIQNFDESDLSLFRGEYQRDLKAINLDKERLENERSSVISKIQEIENSEIDIDKLVRDSRRVLELVKEADPQALRSALKELFSKIIVGDLDSNGNRQLVFFFKNTNSRSEEYLRHLESMNLEENFSIKKKMG